MGREVVKEMNRVGMVVDMSHSGEKSTLDAIEYSERPIAITHANPHNWHQALRNKSDTVMRELSNSGGMLGFSIYPHHLKGGTSASSSPNSRAKTPSTRRVVSRTTMPAKLLVPHTVGKFA